MFNLKILNQEKIQKNINTKFFYYIHNYYSYPYLIKYAGYCKGQLEATTIY